MADTIEKANTNYEIWLNAQLHKPQPPPNTITECIDCGGDIGDKRKTAMPSAQRCIACQTNWEQKR